LAGIVRAAQACYDFSKYYQTPFISGKDSLNNEYKVKGRSIPIAGTLLISAISVIEDVNKVVSSDLKEAGNLLYCLGATYDELGGSHYYDILEELGADVPRVNKKIAKDIMDSLSKATERKIVCAAHDCSEGGIGVALSEMAFSGGFGAEISLKEVPFSTINGLKKKRDDVVLFSESNSRFIVEVKRENQKEFEKIIKGLPFGLVGCVIPQPYLKIFGLEGKIVLHDNIWELKENWQKTLRW